MTAKKKQKRVLTECDWRKVFEVRCKCKQGQTITDEERKLFIAALESDPKRYRDMETDVFNATVPFGSTVYKK